MKGKRLLCSAVAFLVSVTLLLAQATESPLARLRVDAKHVGWDGVDLAISVVQAERRVGTVLALSAVAESGCARYQVAVERDTLRLTLGFPSAKPGAKLESLYVHFEGYQVLAKRDDLVAELKRVAPQATYFAPPSVPDLKEADAADPSYLLPGEEGYAVRVDAGRGLLLARRDCIR